MIKLVFIFSSLFVLNTTGIPNENTDKIETSICENDSCYLDISSIEVYEIEETVNLGFNTNDYLPENFNPLKGKGNIDWSTVEIYEIEEDVDLGFDTKDYLPKNFNSLKGKGDVEWEAIKLAEIEEEVEISFDTKKYLPENFSPCKGMS
ncbi:hypothetical protein [Flavivirga spongiicola]|uniref:GLPGLI family protein n=1 Tax=Flavivirga spongiicola TaxID=421621 RepID=A0ABU7XVG0_9FLAO|nr:hypothetical protein [Flavivirga sp. MEBiC05379]MDO5979754.1 hypothetical protein [Flavivirga sp. MEBiC05379]